MIKSRTYIATPPGATIKEQLAERSMSQKEFAERMEMSEKCISRLINGEVQLTSEVAMRLEMVLGLPACFWNNLESIYREKLGCVQMENELFPEIKSRKAKIRPAVEAMLADAKKAANDEGEYSTYEDIFESGDRVDIAKSLFGILPADVTLEEAKEE